MRSCAWNFELNGEMKCIVVCRSGAESHTAVWKSVILYSFRSIKMCSDAAKLGVTSLTPKVQFVWQVCSVPWDRFEEVLLETWFCWACVQCDYRPCPSKEHEWYEVCFSNCIILGLITGLLLTLIVVDMHHIQFYSNTWHIINKPVFSICACWTSNSNVYPHFATRGVSFWLVACSTNMDPTDERFLALTQILKKSVISNKLNC